MSEPIMKRTDCCNGYGFKPSSGVDSFRLMHITLMAGYLCLILSLLPLLQPLQSPVPMSLRTRLYPEHHLQSLKSITCTIISSHSLLMTIQRTLPPPSSRASQVQSSPTPLVNFIRILKSIATTIIVPHHKKSRVFLSTEERFDSPLRHCQSRPC